MGRLGPNDHDPAQDGSAGEVLKKADDDAATGTGVASAGHWSTETPIAMIRCHLDGAEDHSAHEIRYIPAAEFDLWRHFMETRHTRVVTVDAVSVWLPEAPGILDGEIDADALEPVLRVRFEKPGLQGSVVPVVRFFPTETYPQAKAALLAHFDPRCRWSLQATPGYFIGASSVSDLDNRPEVVEVVA